MSERLSPGRTTWQYGLELTLDNTRTVALSPFMAQCRRAVRLDDKSIGEVRRIEHGRGGFYWQYLGESGWRDPKSGVKMRDAVLSVIEQEESR